jgi:protein ImuB
LWLISPPERLEVVSIVPDGPPLRFQFSGRSHTVACHWGPERIETGWWRSSAVRRDYYRVETAGGERFWLFRRLHDGAWFLQGEFA